MLNYSFLIGL